MRFSREEIVWQEVPGEVSLAFTISGCPLACRGCHSADTWAPEQGSLLSPAYLQQRLQQYRGLITCVLFMGGEWQPDLLRERLQQVREAGLHTCLYTGLEDVSPALKSLLTYLKTGPWRPELGGLDSPHTNQRFVDLRTNQCLNHHFQ